MSIKLDNMKYIVLRIYFRHGLPFCRNFGDRKSFQARWLKNEYLQPIKDRSDPAY